MQWANKISVACKNKYLLNLQVCRGPADLASADLASLILFSAGLGWLTPSQSAAGRLSSSPHFHLLLCWDWLATGFFRMAMGGTTAEIPVCSGELPSRKLASLGMFSWSKVYTELYKHFSRPLLVSYLLTSCWPKQIIWLSAENGMALLKVWPDGVDTGRGEKLGLFFFFYS